MNPLLEINVIKYNPQIEAIEPIIVVSFQEKTPYGNGGFGYPLSPNEVKVLIAKLQDAIKPPETSQVATLEDVAPIKKDK